MPPELLGPYGLVVAAVTVVAILWKLHLDADKRDRDRADRYLAGWEAQTSATARLADVQERRERDDQKRT